MPQQATQQGLDPQQIAQDPGFQKLSDQEKNYVLSKAVPEFGKLNSDEQSYVLSKLPQQQPQPSAWDRLNSSIFSDKQIDPAPGAKTYQAVHQKLDDIQDSMDPNVGVLKRTLAGTGRDLADSLTTPLSIASMMAGPLLGKALPAAAGKLGKAVFGTTLSQDTVAQMGLKAANTIENSLPQQAYQALSKGPLGRMFNAKSAEELASEMKDTKVKQAMNNAMNYLTPKVRTQVVNDLKTFENAMGANEGKLVADPNKFYTTGGVDKAKAMSLAKTAGKGLAYGAGGSLGGGIGYQIIKSLLH